MSDVEIAELERRIHEGEVELWDALDAALARAGLPPRRVWHVFSSRGEYADKDDMTWVPYFQARADAVAFMERLARERPEWVRSTEEPDTFHPDGRFDAGVMHVEAVELVPSGGRAIGRCAWRHSSQAPECQKRAGHA